MREKTFHFAIELRRKSFVVRHHQRRLSDILNNVRNRKSFSASCYAEQCLISVAAKNPFAKLLNCLRLVAGWGEVCGEVEHCRKSKVVSRESPLNVRHTDNKSRFAISLCSTHSSNNQSLLPVLDSRC